MNPYGYALPAARASLGDRVGFLRRVYGLFFASLLMAGVGAVAGLEPSVLRVTMAHPLLCWGGEMGLIFACMAMRRRAGINMVLLFAFTFVSGVVLTPMLVLATLRTGGFAVVAQAFATTCLVFGGLSIYTLVTKQDFSWMRGFVVTALFALIGVALLNAFFFHSGAVQMAMSAAGVLVFSCWVLFDTSRILRSTPVDDAVGAALSLYLDFINLFLSILQLMSGRRR